MSSTLQSPPKPSGEGGRQYVGFEEYIEYQLKQARSGIRGADLLTGGVGAVLLLVGYLFLFVVTDHWVISGGWSQTSRYVLWTGFLAVLGAWTWYKFVQPWSQRVTQLYAASQLEGAHPELKSNLLTLVDLQQAGRPVSPVIIEAMERRAAMNLQQVNIDDAVDRHALTKLSYALLAMVLVLCVYTLASPKSLMSSAWRALFPMANVTLSTRTAILEVKPGDITVLAHATPDIETTLSGAIPAEVRVLYTTADRRMVDEIVKLQETDEGVHRYRGRLVGESGNGLMQNVTYRIEAGDAVSPTYSITVRQPPTATVQEVAYDYPTYMGIDDRTQQDSAIDAWEGTFVTVRALTNVPVDSATVLFSDTEDTALKAEELPMQIADGVHLSAQWQLKFRSDGSFPRFYRIQLARKSEQGDELVAVPTLHTQRIRADLPPKLTILHPTEDMELPANGSLPVAYEASDPDFLLKSVVMKFEKDGEALTKQELLFDAPPFEPQTRGQHLLNLEQFAVEPGKTLTFWLEAKDNFEPFADRLGNVTRSPKITITIIDPVTPEQAQQKQDEQQQAADQKIEQAEQAANPPQELGPDGQPQDPANQPPDAPMDPIGDNPPGTEPMPMPNQGADPAQPMPEQGDPMNGDPQPGKPQSGKPKPGQTQKGQPQNPQPQPGQQQPNPPPEGQPQQNPSPQGQPQPNPQKTGKSKSGQPQTGSSSTGQPQQEPDSGTPPQGGEPNKTQPQNTSPESTKPQPRPERATEDEVLKKLLERERDRKLNAEKQPKPGEPRPGDPKPGDATENPQGDMPPPNAGDAPKPGETKTKPEATKPGETQPKPGVTDKPRPGTSDPQTTNPSEPGSGEKPMPPPPEQTTGRPDPAKPPMKNGPKPGTDPVQPKTQPGTDPDPTKPDPSRDPMPKEPGAEGTDPAPMPGSPDAENPGIDKPGVKPPKPKPETKPGQPEKTTGEQPGQSPMPAEKPMPNDGTGTPMPAEPGAEKPATEPQTKPMAPKSTGPPKPGDKPPQGTDPKANDPAQPGQPMPGDKPQPGQQTQPGESTEPTPPSDVQKPKPPGEKMTPNTQPPKDPGQKQTPDKQNPSQKPPQQRVGEKPPMDNPQSDSGTDSPSNSGTDTGKPGDSPSTEGTPGKTGTPGGEATKPGTPGTGEKQPGGSSKPGSPTGGKPMPGESPSGPSDPANPSEPMPPGEAVDNPPMTPSGTDPGQPGAPPKPGDKPQTGDSQKPKTGPAKSKPGENPTEGQPMPAEPGEMPPEAGSEGGGEGAGGGPKPEGAESETPAETAPAEAGKPPKPGNGNKPAPKGTQKKPGAQGNKPSESGEPQSGESPPGGPPTPGEGSSGTPSSGSEPGAGAQNGPPQGGTNPADTENPAEAAPLNSPEEAVNLENRKKAAALAIKQLQEELSRGETPQDLLDQTGLNEAELDAFLKQLDQNLNKAGDESSPEAQARRRQFDELLKGVELDSPGELKSGGNQERKATESSGTNRRPAPPKYKSADEAYKKRLQKAP